MKTPAEQAVAAMFMALTAMGAMLLVLVVPADPLFMNVVSSFALLTIALAATSNRFSRLPQFYFAALVTLFAGLALFAQSYPDFVGMPYMVLVAVFAGIVFDFFAIAATRRLVEWQTVWSSFGKMAEAAIVQLAIGVSMIAAPIYLGFHIMHAAHGTSPWYAGLGGWSILLSALTNVASAAIAFSFFGALALLTAHRLLWPIIERPLYQLARLGVFKSKATRAALFALGVSTTTVGLGGADNVASLFLNLL